MNFKNNPIFLSLLIALICQHRSYKNVVTTYTTKVTRFHSCCCETGNKFLQGAWPEWKAHSVLVWIRQSFFMSKSQLPRYWPHFVSGVGSIIPVPRTYSFYMVSITEQNRKSAWKMESIVQHTPIKQVLIGVFIFLKYIYKH